MRGTAAAAAALVDVQGVGGTRLPIRLQIEYSNLADKKHC